MNKKYLSITALCVLIVCLGMFSAALAGTWHGNGGSYRNNGGNYGNNGGNYGHGGDYSHGGDYGHQNLYLLDSYATPSVGMFQTYHIQCDFGIQLPCIAPTSTAGPCSFTGFSGTAANFVCIAQYEGLQHNTCNIFYYPPDHRCLNPQANQIQSTNVCQDNGHGNGHYGR